MGLLRNSALYAPTFDKKLARMLEHDYTNANFPLKHLGKDVQLFGQAAESNGLDSSLTQTLLQLLEKAQDAGYADADYAVLYEAINPGFDMGGDAGC